MAYQLVSSSRPRIHTDDHRLGMLCYSDRNDGAEGGSTRSLIRAALNDSPRNDEEEIVGGNKPCDTKNDQRNDGTFVV